jgi:hypothetical protein
MTLGVAILYLTTFAGLFLMPRIRPVIFLLILLLLVVTSANETWITVLNKVEDPTMRYNIFSLFEISCWSTLLIFLNKFRHYKLHIAFVVLLLAASVVEIIVRPGFHSYTYRVFSLYSIVCCVSFFYQLATLRKETRILVNGSFWMATGLLIFQFVFAFYLTALDIPEFRKAEDALIAFRTVFNTINILYYLLILYGMICLSFYRQ